MRAPPQSGHRRGNRREAAGSRLPQDVPHRSYPARRPVPPNPCSCAAASHPIGAREYMRRTALVADNENTSTETEEAAPGTEETDAVAPDSTDTGNDEAADETPAEAEEPQPEPEPEPEAEPEPELPRFAAPFSSPEPP